jgi:hypothetical protein
MRGASLGPETAEPHPLLRHALDPAAVGLASRFQLRHSGFSDGPRSRGACIWSPRRLPVFRAGASCLIGRIDADHLRLGTACVRFHCPSFVDSANAGAASSAAAFHNPTRCLETAVCRRWACMTPIFLQRRHDVGCESAALGWIIRRGSRETAMARSEPAVRRISTRRPGCTSRQNIACQTESMTAAIAEATAAVEDIRSWRLEDAQERLLRAVADLDATMKELTDGE